jgi:predicted enzyme related to lactoylglutathione lyase
VASGKAASPHVIDTLGITNTESLAGPSSESVGGVNTGTVRAAGMTETLSDSYTATLVPVKNMDRAVKFYTESLGGKLLFRDTGEMKDSWASIKMGKSEFWLIAPETREKRTLAYSTFVVKDIRAVVKDLKSKGVKFQKADRMSKETKVEGPIAVESFGASAFLKDSEGNLLMVWQNAM